MKYALVVASVGRRRYIAGIKQYLSETSLQTTTKTEEAKTFRSILEANAFVRKYKNHFTNQKVQIHKINEGHA